MPGAPPAISRSHSPRDDVDAEGAHRGRVVHEAFHLQRHPARDLDAVARRELRDLRVVVDRHDARHDGHRDAQRAHLVDEVEVGVGVEEELRDRRVGAGLDLVREVLQVAPRVALLRVVFGVGRDLDVPVGALGLGG